MFSTKNEIFFSDTLFVTVSEKRFQFFRMISWYHLPASIVYDYAVCQLITDTIPVKQTRDGICDQLTPS